MHGKYYFDKNEIDNIFQTKWVRKYNVFTRTQNHIYHIIIISAQEKNVTNKGNNCDYLT